MTAAAKQNLRTRMHEIYKQIDFIAKDGENTGQSYSYTKAVDVVRNVRQALIAQRIFAEINFDFVGEPYTIARKKEPTAPFSAVNVKCFIVFHDLDSDEKLTGSGLGTGGDTGDKSVYKAMTGALKYALKTSFMIPDEASPDAEADPALDENARNVTNVEPTDEPLPEAQPDPEPAPALKPAAAQIKTKPLSVPKAEIPTETPTAPPAKAESREPGDVVDEGEDTSMPSDEEMTVFRTKFKKLGDELTIDGKLKASTKPSLPVNRKILVFLLNITKAKDATLITRAQWTNFFERVEAIKATEVGMVGLATLVNRVNGVEEKKK